MSWEIVPWTELLDTYEATSSAVRWATRFEILGPVEHFALLCC
jgi:hypothetical protein